MRKLRILGLGVALMGAAIAAEDNYEELYPARPCQDGWAACVVEGESVDPGPVLDGAGRPLPADLRVGWFDLSPTAAFSPFVGLSAYGTEPAPEPEPEPAAEAPTEAPAEPVEAVEAPADPEEPVAAAPTPTPVAAAPTPTPVAAAPTTTPATNPGVPAGRPATNPGVPAGRPAANPGVPAGVPTGSTQAMSNTGTQPVAVAEPVAPVVKSSAPAGCDDLVALEPSALMGKLTPVQRDCLEKSLNGAGSQTQKDKISRVLLSNAEAAGDKKEWERLAKRHLEDIDRSDPDLCFKYALHLSKGGVGRAQGTIKWADAALENKNQWSGTTYKTRVYSLYQLRAEAATQLWMNAVENLNKGEGDRDKLTADEEKYRGMARDYSREWLDYAKASGQDVKKPMALCVSAAGSKKYCEE